MATYHPSSILRAIGSEQEEQKRDLYDDLKAAAVMAK